MYHVYSCTCITYVLYHVCVYMYHVFGSLVPVYTCMRRPPVVEVCVYVTQDTPSQYQILLPVLEERVKLHGVPWGAPDDAETRPRFSLSNPSSCCRRGHVKTQFEECSWSNRIRARERDSASASCFRVPLPASTFTPPPPASSNPPAS
jgi:hypothetical protein